MRSGIFFSWMFVAMVMSAAVPVRAAESLEADLDKSKISFKGSKPDGSSHDGGFKKFVVNATADFDNPSNSSLRIEIDTASLWADDKRLEGHLKNPDFFDVRKYPKIVFESTDVQQVSDSEVKIIGKMKMLDKVVDVEVPTKTEVSDSQLKLVAAFELDRMKWGMDYGKGKINDVVEITAELVLDR